MCNTSRHLANSRVQKCQHQDKDSISLKDTYDACQSRHPIWHKLPPPPLPLLDTNPISSSLLPFSSLPVMCPGSSNYSSYSKTPLPHLLPPTQTAPPPPPAHPLTATAAKRGKRGRTKRRKTRRSGKGSESTSLPKPVTVRIQTEFVALIYVNVL